MRGQLIFAAAIVAACSAQAFAQPSGKRAEPGLSATAGAGKSESGRGGALPRTAPLPPPRPKALTQDQRQQSETPPPRPNALTEDQKKGPQTSPPRTGETAAEGAPADVVCLARLRESGADVEPVATVAPVNGCGVETPVRFKGVRLNGGGVVALDQGVTIRCDLAEQLALWIRDDLEPITRRHGLALSGLSGVGGYECRGRNRQIGGTRSEHSTGNAFDVRRLIVMGAKPIEIMRQTEDGRTSLREDIRTSACARFTTVLGTGSDGFHDDHLHVDMRQRRGGHRLCQWDLGAGAQTPD